ncbi:MULTISPECIES: hypothetical protein [unclassified Lentimicrobium]|uniref:hypothetical protein n=1 Tax=unclassified Lentimicrobium TaxID=2677434 RepID=UPI001554A7D6|nr:MULTISPECIES: hypothetical protein [unclassified Lentimicrobium]NPD45065.1 hypothetical protein [Lentimicrobium sp. S6]NPD84537.1 hypothetical protein [Lentimicrobium sp. L6]
MAKRRRFKQMSFKLSNRQYSSLQNYCGIEKITPNKLIKGLLKSYTDEFTDEKIGKREIDEMQLSLFREPKPEDYKQLTIFGSD